VFRSGVVIMVAELVQPVLTKGYQIWSVVVGTVVKVVLLSSADLLSMNQRGSGSS